MTTIDSLVLRMLDFRIAPVFLPGEDPDGASKLGQPLAEASQRQVAHLTGASALEVDAVASR